MTNKSGIYIIVAFLLISITAPAQAYKNVFPIGTYHIPNTTINGISGGIISTTDQRSNTNGIKLEVPGAGLLLLMTSRSPISINETEYQRFAETPVTSRGNGIILSALGTTGGSYTNGISLGYIGQLNGVMNGLSTSMAVNFAETHNGIQLAGVFSIAYKANGLQVSSQNKAQVSNGIQVGVYNFSADHHGLQIGLVNKSKQTKGIQLGLWNENEKRKLPLINWNF